MKRILITGSRNWTNDNIIRNALLEHGPGVVVHGGCRGADGKAARIALELGWAVECHDVTGEEWDLIGPAAGPQRNQRMVDLGADVCLAFPMTGSKGTWTCVRMARKAGIPTFVYPVISRQ